MLARFLDPDVDSYLLDDQGEVLISEFKQHPITYLFGLCGFGVAILFFLFMAVWPKLLWLFLALGLLCFACSLIYLQQQYMRRFVITNMRVFTTARIINQVSYMMALDQVGQINCRVVKLGRLVNFGDLELVDDAGGVLKLKYVANPKYRRQLIEQVMRNKDSWPTS